MPFFIADPDWQGRARDGIPGQSLIHRPVMEGSDCSSSDDEDTEIDENPDPDRMSKSSHKDPHTAVKEYHQCQIEEIIVAIKDFDTYAARYPPEAMPKPSSYYVDRGIPGELDIYPEIDRDPLSACDSSSTAISIESQTTCNEQGAVVDFYDRTDRELRTSHVLCGRNLTPTSHAETSACATPRSERYSATSSIISDFVQWPATTQGASTPPSQATAAREPSEANERKPGLFSAARKFFTGGWPKKSSRPDTEASGANLVRQRSGSGSSTAASSSAVFSDTNFVDISFR